MGWNEENLSGPGRHTESRRTRGGRSFPSQLESRAGLHFLEKLKFMKFMKYGAEKKPCRFKLCIQPLKSESVNPLQKYLLLSIRAQSLLVINSCRCGFKKVTIRSPKGLLFAVKSTHLTRRGWSCGCRISSVCCLICSRWSCLSTQESSRNSTAGSDDRYFPPGDHILRACRWMLMKCYNSSRHGSCCTKWHYMNISYIN